MGLVYANIELINSGDMEMARRYMIGEEDVKRMNVNILVDTGAYNLCINESIQEQLDLPFIEKRKAQLANRATNRDHIEESINKLWRIFAVQGLHSQAGYPIGKFECCFGEYPSLEKVNHADLYDLKPSSRQYAQDDQSDHDVHRTEDYAA